MISIIHYISAKRRLEEADKTFAMLDGDVSPMMRAQRDMIKFEAEYYQERVGRLALYALGVAIVSLVCYITYAVFIHVGVL
jgi:hypothetical protein